MFRYATITLGLLSALLGVCALVAGSSAAVAPAFECIAFGLLFAFVAWLVK